MQINLVTVTLCANYISESNTAWCVRFGYAQLRSTDKRSREAELIKTLAMLHEATASLSRCHVTVCAVCI